VSDLKSRDTFFVNLRKKRAQLAAGMTEAEIDAENDRGVLARAAERRQQVTRWQARAARADNTPRLDVALTDRARNSPHRGPSREQRPQGRRTRAPSASGDGPLPPSDDDPPDELTPLQRGFLLLLEALVTTGSDGLRTFLTFLEMAAARVAAEIARLEDWSERP
jgi:hypothetical protein